MDNLNYRDNDALKRVGVQLSYTQDQIDEYIKCSQDAFYFINNHIKIISLDEGLVPFKLWPYQEKLISLLHNNRFVISKQPRQVGKCVNFDTILKIKNKKTGKIVATTIGEFYNKNKDLQKTKNPSE